LEISPQKALNIVRVRFWPVRQSAISAVLRQVCEIRSGLGK
jgi:hypothetical protein